MNKTACVIGATGLVGSHLVQQLLDDDDYQTIKIFSRRSVNIDHPKIEEHIVDFGAIDSFKKKIVGDILFSTMGTTIKTAGSKEAQYLVDFTYQYQIAKTASDNGIKHYVLVSSAGANAESKFFYMRMKGELDDAVRELNFNYISILRPATLEGNRVENRAGEKAAIRATAFFSKLIPGLRKYRPVHASIVARAMISSVNRSKPKRYKIFAYDEVFNLAGS